MRQNDELADKGLLDMKTALAIDRASGTVDEPLVNSVLDDVMAKNPTLHREDFDALTRAMERAGKAAVPKLGSGTKVAVQANDGDESTDDDEYWGM